MNQLTPVRMRLILSTSTDFCTPFIYGLFRLATRRHPNRLPDWHLPINLAHRSARL